MRTFLFALAMLVCAAVSAAGEDFKGSCTYGLSEYGVDVKTNCSIRWADPSTSKMYCFGNEEVLGKSLEDPGTNIREAEQTNVRYSK